MYVALSLTSCKVFFKNWWIIKTKKLELILDWPLYQYEGRIGTKRGFLGNIRATLGASIFDVTVIFNSKNYDLKVNLF